MRTLVTIIATTTLISAVLIGAPSKAFGLANEIYVGSNDDATAASSCADPDFSTDPSDESSINAALDAALAAIDDDADTIIICEGEYEYQSDISVHDGAVDHDVISIEAEANKVVTLSGIGQYQLLSFENVTSVYVSGITFNAAQSDPNGAAIEIIGGELSVADSIFTDGEATENGGAIYSEPGHVDISGSTFARNWADDEGGAVAVEEAAEGEGVSVTQSYFTDNLEAEGAAISVNGADSGAIITVVDSEFENNDGAYGAITIDDGAVVLDHVLMNGNNATTGAGGAVWSGEGLTATDSEFSNNSAVSEGGAVYSGGDVEVVKSLFASNSSGGDSEGGAISVEYCDMALVSRSTFIQNSAGDDGGGALNFDCNADAEVLVTGNSFKNNSARRYGGAIDQEDDVFTIQYVGNTFTGNAVTDSSSGRDGEGGAVWAYSATFSRNRFIRNTASDFGGAIYVWSDAPTARSANRSGFSGNRARRGANVYLARD